MRIAVAVHGYPPAGCGGVERVASEQAEALAVRGHSLFVFCREQAGEGEDGATRDETVGDVSVRRVVVRDGARNSFSDYYEGDFLDRSFRRFLEDVRPDVLHVQHLVSLSTRLLDVAHDLGVPVVLSLHDAYFLCHRLFLIDAQGERCPGPDAGLRCVGCLAEHGVGDLVRHRFDAMAKRLDRVERITAPSPSLRARYEEEFPFLRGRIEIVEPGIPERPPVAPRERRADGAPLRLLFAGTLMPHKGLDVLIDAFEGLSDGDFELTVHGEAVVVGDTWAQQLRDRTADRAVHWRGAFPASELADVLARADVLVLPSRCDESWSRVVREARVAGLAVVAPSTGGPADWLRDGEDALLVEPGSVAALGSALSRLSADPGLRAALSSPATGVPTVAEAATTLETAFTQVTASRARKAPLTPTRVTVAYVTKNGGSCIEESVRAVRAQKGDFERVEILAVDSGSTDETLGILAKHGARVVQIPPNEFGHGRTRNLAAREATGDVVAFLTQDAAPADEHWLARLLVPLEEDPLCAATWSRHVPRPECHPMEWRMLTEHPPFRPEASAIQSARGNPDYAANPDGQCSLSNNGAAYRREDLLRRPFPNVSFAEDRAWARDALETGWRTVLVRDSILRHSHSYSAWVNLRRNFDHWRAMAEELEQVDGFTLMQGWRASAREARNDLRFWSGHTGRSVPAVGLRWAVPATLYHLGAFTGRWLGSHTKWLPPGVADWLSMHRMPDSTGSK